MPRDFLFAVKVPRLITHELRFRRTRQPFERFVLATSGLGRHRGPLLVQLPPSFDFDARVVARFFAMVRQCYEGSVVCEPRHRTWFTAAAEALLVRYRIARVAADPAITEASRTPGGWKNLAYFRLHGSPHMYWSRYDSPTLARLAIQLAELPDAREVWCVFDNTAAGAAIENARELQDTVHR